MFINKGNIQVGGNFIQTQNVTMKSERGDVQSKANKGNLSASFVAPIATTQKDVRTCD